MGDIFLYEEFMYPKPPLKYEEQLEKLKKRGCIINDDKKCISIFIKLLTKFIFILKYFYNNL